MQAVVKDESEVVLGPRCRLGTAAIAVLRGGRAAVSGKAGDID